MRGALLSAALVGALVLAAVLPSALSTMPGYWDTDTTLKGKGREPFLIEYNGSLWNIFQYRTELKDVGINMSGRRSDIYYTVLNSSVGNGPARTGNVTDWSAPVSLVPKSKDENGHGVHTPYASVYKGKLYVSMEAVEPSIKDDDAQGDYDILLRVFDGLSWDPPLDSPARVISERNDINVSDTECRSITFRDTLYFIWDQVPVNVEAGNQPLANMRQIVYRTFDGAAWGPITLAARENTSIFSVPHVAVFKDSLWVSFSTNSSEQADTDVSVVRFDGSSWSAPQRVNPAVEGSAVRRQNMNSRLSVFGDRLYCAWQSADAIAKSGRDYDILVSSTDGISGWAAPAEVNPPADSDSLGVTGQDITPDIKACNGTLYVAWASNSTRINDGGEDFDIMLRPFNGTAWGPITQVSPAGDNGTISGDHNVGDDNTPWLLAWNGSLYCTWISYDQKGIGHVGGNPSVIVRRVLGPGAGTNPDNNPPVENGAPEAPAPFPWAPVAVVLAAAVAVVAMVLAFRPSRGGTARNDRTEKDNMPKGKD
jgi:hypothetical protein